MELILEQVKSAADRWGAGGEPSVADQARAAWGKTWGELKEGSAKAGVTGGAATRRVGVLDRGLLGLLRRAVGRVGDRNSSQRPLRLIERINVGPRQAVTLVEADGFRVLVATSAEGSPAFYALPRAGTKAAAEGGLSGRPGGTRRNSGSPHMRLAPRTAGRVSW